jgi:Fur family ferric uptake transcriptional regulator
LTAIPQNDILKMKFKIIYSDVMDKFPPAQFHQLLKERGLKSTRQRDEILQVFLESAPHLSIEELYRRVRQRNPRIGYTTVYRTLKLMAQSGLASLRQFGDGMARFERCAGGEHHDHLICLSCGKIVEFESERIEAMQSRIARRQGFRVLDHKLELYGHCPDCAAKRKEVGGKRRGKEGNV